MDANHCPGAVQFLFELPGGGPRYVHCGDMRFCAALTADPHLRRFVGARAVFLDTTYCNPRFVFPPQAPPLSLASSIPLISRPLSAIRCRRRPPRPLPPARPVTRACASSSRLFPPRGVALVCSAHRRPPRHAADPGPGPDHHARLPR